MPIWQPHLYDFNLWTERKRIEKLSYMHRNPVTWGLVLEPEQWRWSSFRSYVFGEVGLFRINNCDVFADDDETFGVTTHTRPSQRTQGAGHPAKFTLDIDRLSTTIWLWIN